MQHNNSKIFLRIVVPVSLCPCFFLSFLSFVIFVPFVFFSLFFSPFFLFCPLVRGLIGPIGGLIGDLICGLNGLIDSLIGLVGSLIGGPIGLISGLIGPIGLIGLVGGRSNMLV